jgi:dihydrofolate reductase
VRKLIAAMKISVDGKSEGPEGTADWVDAWSDDYDLTPQIDACLLGGRMYPGYEQYWTAIQNDPETPIWITGTPPTPAEIEWADFIKRTPHYVLSSTLNSAEWPNTSFLRTADEVAALKEQSGKDIYLMGGAKITASLADAGLVDELRLIVYPLLAGEGASLFANLQQRRGLELHKAQELDDGSMRLTYTISG